MLIDVTVPNSPGWWLQKLVKKQEDRMPRLERLFRYLEGDPPLPESAKSMRQAYQDFQKTSRTNFAETIVTGISDRISVRSIRTAVADDIDGDELAWGMYTDNNLDIEFADVLENMLGVGDGYMMIGLDPAEKDDTVVITGEDPRQVVTIHDPLHQSEVRAGLKMFHDPDEMRDYLYLFLRGEPILDEEGRPTGEWTKARRFVATRERKTSRSRLRFNAAGFDWDESKGGAEGDELPHRHVPIVRFRNRRGIGEFEYHTDILDRINHTILQRLVITMYQAFRLRAIKVSESDAPAVDPETGQEIDYDDLLSADPGAFIKIPENAELWEGAQADLNGVLSAIKDDLLQLMEVTKTPMPALSDSVQQSAEGAANTKEGHEFKTERTVTRAAASLKLVIMIAFLSIGDTARAEKRKIRIDFFPHQRYSLAEKYDAFSKSTDLPLETRMAEILQFSPELITLAKAQLLEMALTLPADGSSNSGPAAPAA